MMNVKIIGPSCLNMQEALRIKLDNNRNGYVNSST